MATAAVLLKMKIIWSWQLNPYQCDTKEEKLWNRYSDFEIEEIEKGFQQEMDTVELQDRIVDLNYMIQINKSDNQTTPVKREEIDVKKYFREQRFCHAEQPIKSLAIGGWNPEFIIKWENTFELPTGRKFDDPEIVQKMVEQAAKGNHNSFLCYLFQIHFNFVNSGILAEAKLQGKEFDGQKIYDKLMSVKNKGIQEVQRCCVFLYTVESFLYHLVNFTLRTNDNRKIDTLGAYCHLLWYYLYTGDEKKRILYRGSTLSNEAIDEYKQAVGTQSTFKSLAFTSASKCPEVAEMYTGNTLFIIEAMGYLDDVNWCKDISSISAYTDEDEVLITAGHPFIVNKVDFQNGKHVIYLKLSA